MSREECLKEQYQKYQNSVLKKLGFRSRAAIRLGFWRETYKAKVTTTQGTFGVETYGEEQPSLQDVLGNARERMEDEEGEQADAWYSFQSSKNATVKVRGRDIIRVDIVMEPQAMTEDEIERDMKDAEVQGR
jgi:hypothetical protein